MPQGAQKAHEQIGNTYHYREGKLLPPFMPLTSAVVILAVDYDMPLAYMHLVMLVMDMHSFAVDVNIIVAVGNMYAVLANIDLSLVLCGVAVVFVRAAAVFLGSLSRLFFFLLFTVLLIAVFLLHKQQLVKRHIVKLCKRYKVIGIRRGLRPLPF